MHACVFTETIRKLSPTSPQAHPTSPPGYKETSSHSNGHLLVQLQNRVNLPKGILIHDIEGHRVECGGQMYLVLFTPEGAQCLPHSGCPVGEGPDKIYTSRPGQATLTFFVSGTW